MSKINNNQIVSIECLATKLPNVKVDIPYRNFDEMIIESIAFSDDSNPTDTFGLWCSYTNCFVACFAPHTLCANVVPKLSITLNNPCNDIYFKLQYLDNLGAVYDETDIDATIVIVLNFIKYKN